MFRVDRIDTAQPQGTFTLEAHQSLAAFYEREAGCGR